MGRPQGRAQRHSRCWNGLGLQHGARVELDKLGVPGIEKCSSIAHGRDRLHFPRFRFRAGGMGCLVGAEGLVHLGGHVRPFTHSQSSATMGEDDSLQSARRAAKLTQKLVDERRVLALAHSVEQGRILCARSLEKRADLANSDPIPRAHFHLVHGQRELNEEGPGGGGKGRVW